MSAAPSAVHPEDEAGSMSDERLAAKAHARALVERSRSSFYWGMRQ